MQLSTRIIRSLSAEADALTGVRKSCRQTRIASGLLPPQFSLGGLASGWYEIELKEIAAARAAGASDDDVREIVKRQIERRKARAVESGVV